MKNRIITISREFGSGGRTIGRKLAENKKKYLRIYLRLNALGTMMGLNL